MRLDDQAESDNVEDRRGFGVGHAVGGLGIGGVIITLVAMYFGVDPTQVLQQVQVAKDQVQQAQPDAPAKPPARDEMTVFVRKVLGSTEEIWGALFQKAGGAYQPPKLDIYTGAIRSACGLGQAAMGPFYCAGDQKVYIDLQFYQELKNRFHAPGDFAQAYVIAHEVGHHVQNLTGITAKTDAMRSRMSPTEYNRVSVRVELQADCYAGIWAHFAGTMKNQIEPGDIESGLTAASAIGDDKLQQQSRGYVVPESFTHGSSAQRVKWFKTGFDTGSVKACDTFAAGS